MNGKNFSENHSGMGVVPGSVEDAAQSGQYSHPAVTRLRAKHVDGIAQYNVVVAKLSELVDNPEAYRVDPANREYYA